MAAHEDQGISATGTCDRLTLQSAPGLAIDKAKNALARALAVDTDNALATLRKSCTGPGKETSYQRRNRCFRRALIGVA